MNRPDLPILLVIVLVLVIDSWVGSRLAVMAFRLRLFWHGDRFLPSNDQSGERSPAKMLARLIECFDRDEPP